MIDLFDPFFLCLLLAASVLLGFAAHHLRSARADVDIEDDDMPAPAFVVIVLASLVAFYVGLGHLPAMTHAQQPGGHPAVQPRFPRFH